MTYFLAFYGLWLAVAFLVGALCGFGSLRRDGDDPALLREGDFFLALALCLVAILGKAALGRFALYLEGVFALYAAFLAGVGAVVLWAGPISRDHLGWRIGAGAIALIAVVANSEAAKSLEDALEHRLGSLVQREGGDPLNFEVSGRDVFLPADALGHGALAERLASAAGVRIVWRVDSLSPPAAAQREEALAAASAEQAAHRAAEAAWTQREQERIAALAARPRAEAPPPAVKKGRKEKIAEGRSAERPAPAAAEPPAPAALVWNTPKDPTLPAPEGPGAPPPATEAEETSCRVTLIALAASEKIRFSAKSVALGSGAEKFLARLAGSMKRCPDAVLEIRGHADALEDKRALSQRRARTVVDYLRRIGVAREKLTSAGLGDEQPLVAGDDPASRAENRRVEILVR
ncbi:OmpA family protein [Methylosinus sp. H3A]|uniref:OmpA family protein n=1 Tax=Methylosinus sp. H3A TaxID=2785786 RepID=UPI0018C2D289|nr:OmpA family protein [Methylosinus sp. H3A]MBG0810998.1 OmpA family protein [Methylosinus sp. H3A]